MRAFYYLMLYSRIISCKVLKSMKQETVNMKKKISITIEEDLLKWVDEQTKSVEFSSRSHVIEVAISKLRDSNKASVQLL